MPAPQPRVDYHLLLGCPRGRRLDAKPTLDELDGEVS